jgi:CBS domain-containing protein
MALVKSLREILQEARIQELGPRPAPLLPPDGSLAEAVRAIVCGRRGGVVLVEAGRPVGIFTERDIVERLRGTIPSGGPGGSVPAVRTFMSEKLATARRDTSLIEAIRTMVARGCRHLVVVDEAGGLLGLVTTGDIVQFLTDHFPEETLNLPPRLRQSFREPEGA